MKPQTIYIARLNNPLGVFLIKTQHWALIPLFITSYIVYYFFLTQSIGSSSGKIVRTYRHEFERHIKGRHSYRTQRYNALVVVLNDSTRYLLEYESDIKELESYGLIDKNVKISYRYDDDGGFTFLKPILLKQKIPQNNSGSLSMDFFINKIRFEDGTVVRFHTTNWYIIAVFILSLLWVMCGVGNNTVRLWNIKPKEQARVLTTKISGNQDGKAITKFSKCPACGTRLKDNDTECPDCGLNYT